MNKPPSSLHEERLAAAVEHAQQKVAAGERALIEVFIREYYRQVDPDDLAARQRRRPGRRGAVALGARPRARPGRPRVRVFSPTAAGARLGGAAHRDRGRQRRHAFLVDSATMEANRQGLTMHLRVHPVYAVERDPAGALTGLWPRGDRPQATRESWMHIEVDRLVEPEARAGWRPASSACSATCARSPPTGSRCWRA